MALRPDREVRGHAPPDQRSGLHGEVYDDGGIPGSVDDDACRIPLLVGTCPEQVDQLRAGRSDAVARPRADGAPASRRTAYVRWHRKDRAFRLGFTFRQLRAKVRADNRQAWIDRAHRLLSELARRPCTTMDPRSAERISRLRIELELMLNPSEEDHRLLLYLLQRLHVPSHVDSIAGARTLLEVVRDEVASGSSIEAVGWLGSLARADPEQLAGFVVRLSHVVLKREWERVKHTR